MWSGGAYRQGKRSFVFIIMQLSEPEAHGDARKADAGNRFGMKNLFQGGSNRDNTYLGEDIL